MALNNSARVVEPDFTKQLINPRTQPRHKNRALEIRFDDTAKKVLHELIEYYGMPWLSEQMELCPTTIYRLLAGFSDSARPKTVQRLKTFLAGYAK